MPAKNDATPELGSPAERRADYLRALAEERQQCLNAGKADRVKAIDAEIKRASKPVDRKAPDSDEA